MSTRPPWLACLAVYGAACLLGSAGVVSAKPLAAACPIQITSLSPANGTVVGNVIPVQASVTSTCQVQSVVATVTGQSVSLLFEQLSNTWKADVPTASLPFGPFTLTVTATDESNTTASSSVTLEHDAPPVVSIASPAHNDLARPMVHLAATCQDDGPAGCASLIVTRKLHPFDSHPVIIATGTSSIDQDVSLAAVDGKPIILTFIGRDSRSQATAPTRTIYVESSLKLMETIRAPGLVLDDSPTRTLFSDVNSQVSLLDKATGQTTVLLGGASATEAAYLTPAGAMFVARPVLGSSLTARVYEWRNGTLLDLGFPNGSSSLRVSGNYAIWSGTIGAFGLEPGLHLRNLATGTTTTIETSAGNIFNDVAANGDVAYWTDAYEIARYRDGVKTTLTPPGDINNQAAYPVTDGVNIAYARKSAGETQSTWLITPAGEVVLDPDFAGQEFGVTYAVNGGWTAFTRRGRTSRNLWVRSPAGIETQLTFYTDMVSISALSSDGRVAFRHGIVGALGTRLFVVSAGSAPVDVGGAWPAFWRDGNLFLLVGRSVMRARTPAIGDFDGDFSTDMALYRSNGEWVIRQSASGSSTSTVVIAATAGDSAVPGDYDGDGRMDPAVYREATGDWTVRSSITNYTTSFTIHCGGPGYAAAPGDYDGDYRTDPAVYQRSTGSWLILKSSSGYADSIGAVWGGPGFTAVPGQDFDGDGKSDLAVYQRRTGAWRILKSSTGFTASLTVNWGGAGYSLVAGDYDGDGRADLGLYERSTGWWYVLLSGENYTTTLGRNWGGAGFLPMPGDYDGDGKNDLGVFQSSTGNWYILKSTAGYTTTLAVLGWGAADERPVTSAIAVGSDDRTRASDVDGDGTSDITLYNSATSYWYSLTSTSNYTATVNTSWGGAGYTPAPGDFDGDGRADLGVYQQATGRWLVLLSGSGFSSVLSIDAGGPGWVPVAADYDGDGKSDIAVYNASTGLWYVLKSSTGYAAVFSFYWGGDGYTATPGDFDGDPKADLAVYQPSSGTWFVLLSAFGYTTSLSRTVGGAADTPAQGDYDGDGKTDLVVYNTTTGLWHGLTSTTGYTATMSIGWGGVGYTPVQGDYDLDGRSDMAVYQTASGTWLILLSGSNYTTTISKGWGGTGYSPIPGYP